MMTKRRIIAVITITAVLILAAATWLLRNNVTDSAALYITVPIDRGIVERSVSASGTLTPVTLVNVGTQISGVVKLLHADFNDKVSENQVLAELDQSLLIERLKQSEANLASANAALHQVADSARRVEKLAANGYVTREELDKSRANLAKATAEVNVAQAQVASDKVNIGYSVIRSPISGVVVSRDVDVGQTVAASFQTPVLFKIAQDLRKMQINTNLSEADIGNVQNGMAVRFTVDAFPDRIFKGSVRQVRLDPTTVQNVVTYNAVIDVDNDDLTLLPGMTAFVNVIGDARENVLRIPTVALTFNPPREVYPQPDSIKLKKATDNKDNQGGIFVLRDGKPVRVSVSLGLRTTRVSEVTGGDIKEGDMVITRMAPQKPGAQVGLRLF